MHRMIKMHSKYDNMHINVMFYALNCMNNHVLSCLDCMLSCNPLGPHILPVNDSIDPITLIGLPYQFNISTYILIN